MIQITTNLCTSWAPAYQHVRDLILRNYWDSCLYAHTDMIIWIVGTGGATCHCGKEVDVLVEHVIENPYREDNIIVSTHLDDADVTVSAPTNLIPNTYVRYAMDCN